MSSLPLVRVFDAFSLTNKGPVVATFAVLVIAGGVLSGCDGGAGKDVGSSSPAAGQPASAQPGSVKPTAEQEAARRQGEQIGPAIQAANEAAQKGN